MQSGLFVTDKSCEVNKEKEIIARGLKAHLLYVYMIPDDMTFELSNDNQRCSMFDKKYKGEH